MQYQYCPKCGIKYSNTDNENLYKCESCLYVLHLNSKPTVSALIEAGNKVLLGTRKIEPSKGKWDIIGGFLEAFEDPEEGAKREALEETGLEVEIVDYLTCTVGAYEYQNELVPTLNLIYRTKAVGGNLQPDDDVETLEWFDKDNLPSEMAFEGQLEVLQKWKNLKSE